LATEGDAKKNKGADDCYHGRAFWKPGTKQPASVLGL
jgi:hypothetical protein